MAAETMRVWVAVVPVAIGLAGLIGGARLMMTAAVRIAQSLDVSEWLIGLNVVTVGALLPELAAAVVGVLCGEADIVLGDVAGSNLFSFLLILGTTAVVRPMDGP